MTERQDSPTLFLLSWPVVWVAGWLAPAPIRKEWRATRRRKLWHWCAFLEETERTSLPDKLELSRFCWQCYPEALWLRLQRDSTLRRVQLGLHSPQFALAAVFFVLVVVSGFSGGLRATRLLLAPLAYDHSEQLASVSFTDSFSAFRPGVPRDWVTMWSKYGTQVQGAAGYRWNLAIAGSDRHSEQPVLLGLVTPDFFRVLGVRTYEGRIFQSQETCTECAVLSYRLAQRFFGASAVGQRLMVNGAPMMVVGVLPPNFFFLARGDAVWSLMPPPLPTTLTTPSRPRIVGAIVRLKEGVSPEAAKPELRELAQRVTLRDIRGLDVVPLKVQARDVLYPFLLALVAAIVLSAVISHFRFRDAEQVPGSSEGTRFWWVFFASKVLLVLLTASLAAIECGPFMQRIAPSDPTIWLLSSWLCLVFAVVGLLWSFADQKYRCRVCLYRLSSPMTIGNPQRLLLERGGTEMVCPNGHGTLHESVPTTWDDESDRWTNFDSSWQALFGPEEGSKN